MLVTVRNVSDTVVVMSQLDKTKPHVTWGPKSDEVESIQQCPQEMTDTTAFHKAVALGILEVDDNNDALKEAIERAAARYRTGKQVTADATEALIAQSHTQRNGTVVITEADIDRHIDRLNKSQPSDLALDPQS